MKLLKDEKFWTVGLCVMGCAALLWKFIVDPGSWPDIIVNFSQIGVVVILFVIALMARSEGVPYSQVASEALGRLSLRYPKILMGPMFHREPAKSGEDRSKSLEYLFVTNDNLKSRKRAKLLRVDDLENGELFVYVQKGTLAYGLQYGEGNVQEEDVRRVQAAVKEKLTNFIQEKYPAVSSIAEEPGKDVAIGVAFKFREMAKRKYGKAIYECAEVVVQELLRHRK